MTAPATTGSPSSDAKPGGTRPSSGPSAAPGRATIAQKTLRTDRWWLAPLITVALLTIWIAYAVIRTATQKYYYVGGYDYLTPFASPCLSKTCVAGSSLFGQPLPKFPPLMPLGIVVLPFLLCFRLTCYYYRKAYYRSFWASPPACAVPDGHKKYGGETRFPLIIQNAHRYFFYAAVIISVINTIDAVHALIGDDGFQLGVGNLVLWINVIALWAYTVSCHSCRHITGGRLKHFSKHPVRYWAWVQVSKLNKYHMALAWTTLATLAATDLYVALVASGSLTDLRFIH